MAKAKTKRTEGEMLGLLRQAEPTCVQECDCTPVVYVRADVAAASPRTDQTGEGR